MTGGNKRQATKLGEAEAKSREMALVLGRVVLGRDLANRKLDEAPAKTERLESALREVAEGKIKESVLHSEVLWGILTIETSSQVA